MKEWSPHTLAILNWTCSIICHALFFVLVTLYFHMATYVYNESDFPFHIWTKMQPAPALECFNMGKLNPLHPIAAKYAREISCLVTPDSNQMRPHFASAIYRDRCTFSWPQYSLYPHATSSIIYILSNRVRDSWNVPSLKLSANFHRVLSVIFRYTMCCSRFHRCSLFRLH